LEDGEGLVRFLGHRGARLKDELFGPSYIEVSSELDLGRGRGMKRCRRMTCYEGKVFG
jgi:hypothetical protein